MLSAFGISEEDAKESLSRYSAVISDKIEKEKNYKEENDGQEEKPIFD